jgi:predicted MFS family arabinose efflux permease
VQGILLAFAFGNFVIGCGIMIVAAMLNDLAAGLQITVPEAGGLIGVAGVVLFLGAPLAATFTSGIARHRLLVGSLVASAIGHLLCAVAPNYGALLPLRMFAVLGAAVFTPQAAVTVGLLMPACKRNGAIVTIFLGWSVASVAGMPLGSLVGGTFGWRAGFLLVGMLTVIAAIWVARVTPKGLTVPSVSPAIWRNLLTNPPLRGVLLVTLLVSAGQFTVQSYMAPLLRYSIEATPAILSAYFLLFGTSAVIGNMLVTRYVDRLGVSRAVALSLGAILLSQLLWPLSFGSPLISAVLFAVWGAGAFGTGSAQQARLVSVDSSVASASIALNSSLLYAGQALGALVGGWWIEAAGYEMLSWWSSLLLAAAILTSAWVGRRGY